MKVTIKSTRWKSDWDEREEVEVFVDGVLVGGGWYGGEPEDNTSYRTYSWVESLLAATARHLGAEVEYTSEEKAEEG